MLSGYNIRPSLCTALMAQLKFFTFLNHIVKSERMSFFTQITIPLFQTLQSL